MGHVSRSKWKGKAAGNVTSHHPVSPRLPAGNSSDGRVPWNGCLGMAALKWLPSRWAGVEAGDQACLRWVTRDGQSGPCQLPLVTLLSGRSTGISTVVKSPELVTDIFWVCYKYTWFIMGFSVTLVALPDLAPCFRRKLLKIWRTFSHFKSFGLAVAAARYSL